MAKRKLSYSQYLTSTPKKCGIYFWARRGISLLIVLGKGAWAESYIGHTGSVIVGINIFAGVYVLISLSSINCDGSGRYDELNRVPNWRKSPDWVRKYIFKGYTMSKNRECIKEQKYWIAQNWKKLE